MRKHLIIFLALVFIIGGAFGAYYAAWNYAAGLIRTGIDNLYATASEQFIVIEGDRPAINGFPGKHSVRYAGRINDGKVIIEVPELTVTGIFLPGQTVRVRLPQGARVVGSEDPDIWSADALEMDAVIPNPLPADGTRSSMQAWRDQGGQLEIERIAFDKGSLKAEGPAIITLDQNLQPAMNATLRLRGYIEFIAWLKDRGTIEQRDALIAGTILAGLSQEMPGGERYVDIPLTLQNRNLMAGPLRIAEIEAVNW